MCQLELTGTRIDPCKKAFLHKISKHIPWIRVLKVDREFVSNVDISNYVPTLGGVIQRNIPDFWKIGILNPIVPVWKQPSYTKTSRSNPKRDERNFRYYANALHAELQIDVDGPSSIINDYSKKQPERILSGHEYQRFYADLAVGRRIDRFLQPQQPLLMDLHTFQQRHLYKLYRSLSMGWDKIRAATSISIGTNHD
jgi:hypothetical protein